MDQLIRQGEQFVDNPSTPTEHLVKRLTIGLRRLQGEIDCLKSERDHFYNLTAEVPALRAKLEETQRELAWSVGLRSKSTAELEDALRDAKKAMNVALDKMDRVEKNQVLETALRKLDKC